MLRTSDPPRPRPEPEGSFDSPTSLAQFRRHLEGLRAQREAHLKAVLEIDKVLESLKWFFASGTQILEGTKTMASRPAHAPTPRVFARGPSTPLASPIPIPSNGSSTPETKADENEVDGDEVDGDEVDGDEVDEEEEKELGNTDASTPLNGTTVYKATNRLCKIGFSQPAEQILTRILARRGFKVRWKTATLADLAKVAPVTIRALSHGPDVLSEVGLVMMAAQLWSEAQVNEPVVPRPPRSVPSWVWNLPELVEPPTRNASDLASQAGFAPRTESGLIRALERARVCDSWDTATLANLSKLTTDDLRAVTSIPMQMSREVRRALAEAGLRLADDAVRIAPEATP